MKLTNYLKSFARDEEGGAAIEYGLIASLISVVIATAVKEIGPSVKGFFDTINAAI